MINEQLKENLTESEGARKKETTSRMKMSHHLVFLVLAISSISWAQSETGVPDPDPDPDPQGVPFNSTSPLNQTGNENESKGPTTSRPTFPKPLTPTSSPPSGSPVMVTTTDKDTRSDNSTEDENEDTTANATTSTGVTKGKTRGGDVNATTTVVTSSKAASTVAVVEKKGNSVSWGYVFLVLIILVIIILCVVLYMLRRVSRTYSFDLHRPNPMSHFNEPTGTFEPVYVDDLDQTDLKDIITDDSSPPPAANGMSIQPEENGLSGDTAPQEEPDANSVETTLASNATDASPSSGGDQADKTVDSLSGTNLLFDFVGEQQNENNNNPSARGSDPFVEINLDEPAWSDQLLNSVQAPSSVIPFSSFSSS